MHKTDENSKLLEENLRLKSAVEELSILNDIATAVSSTQSLEAIVELIIQRCVKYLKVEQGAIMLLDEKDIEKPFRTMVRKQISSSDFLPYRFDSQLTGWMLKNRMPLLVNDLKTDERFSITAETDFSIKTLLSVPLLLKGKMIGLLTLFNKKSDYGFSANDQRLLSIIAAQSTHLIENARLLLKEKELMRIEEEMRMAKQIQLNILPKQIPEIPGYDVYAVNIPAHEVGGDYYDFIFLSNNKIAFCLGDITGKGLPAAMLMANLQATLRGQALTQRNVSECIKNSNILLFNSTDTHMYATLFYAELDLSDHMLTYCNAGHCRPININGSELCNLNEGGIIIGCFESAEFKQSTKVMKVNELIVIYSDGVTEAMDKEHIQFGEDRLNSIIISNASLSPKELSDLIISEVKKHSYNVEQTDDITLMAIKRIY